MPRVLDATDATAHAFSKRLSPGKRASRTGGYWDELVRFGDQSGAKQENSARLSCRVEESMSLRPINREEKYPCGDRCLRPFDHVEVEPRPVNLLYVKIPLEHGWPP